MPGRLNENGTQTETPQVPALLAPLGNEEVTEGASGNVGWQADQLSSHAKGLMSSAMTQLFEMGFWNKELNKQLLEKVIAFDKHSLAKSYGPLFQNKCNVGDTVEELLRSTRTSEEQGASAPVVSRQPRQLPNYFIHEFD